MITQDTSKLIIGWDSFSLRILDLILGIIPAAFIGLMILTTFLLVGYTYIPIISISMILILLNLATVIYVSVALEKTKMKALCILFLSFGLIAFIFFVVQPYQIGLFSAPWLFPTTFISVKHIFMLTRPKDFYLAIKIPEQFQKFNDLNFIAKEICLNPVRWKFVQVFFGAFPAIFLLYEFLLWFSKEIIKHQNNIFWFGLTLFAFLYFVFTLLMLIVLPIELKLNQKIHNFIIMFFRATFAYMLLQVWRPSFVSLTGFPVLLLSCAYVSIGMTMYLYHYRSQALIASEVQP